MTKPALAIAMSSFLLLALLRSVGAETCARHPRHGAAEKAQSAAGEAAAATEVHHVKLWNLASLASFCGKKWGKRYGKYMEHINGKYMENM